MPKYTDSEICILGAILLNQECLRECRYEIQPEHFRNERYKAIYRAMLDLDGADTPILPTSILEQLKKTQAKVDVQDISDILSSVQTSAGLRYHVGRVKENHSKSLMIGLSNWILEHQDKMESGELLSEVRTRLSDIREPTASQSIVQLADALPGVVGSIEQRETQAITTGITKLDDLIDGWHPGDLVILAGRPGMGKSILAKDFAESSGVPVLYFSLEMPVNQLIKRQLSAHSGINYTTIRKSKVGEGEWDRIVKAANRLDRIPIAYSDKANMSISELVATCDAYRMKNSLGMVVIDYLQLIRADGKIEHREREVAQISQRLKTLARDLNVPVVCLAQLNRACEARGGDKKPMLSDLRESGSIEQDADTVIFIWRESMYVRKKYDDGTTNEHEALLIVAKGRNSGTGAVKVFFDGAHQRFGNLAKGDRDGGGQQGDSHWQAWR